MSDIVYKEVKGEKGEKKLPDEALNKLTRPGFKTLSFDDWRNLFYLNYENFKEIVTTIAGKDKKKEEELQNYLDDYLSAVYNNPHFKYSVEAALLEEAIKLREKEFKLKENEDYNKLKKEITKRIELERDKIDNLIKELEEYDELMKELKKYAETGVKSKKLNKLTKERKLEELDELINESREYTGFTDFKDYVFAHYGAAVFNYMRILALGSELAVEHRDKELEKIVESSKKNNSIKISDYQKHAELYAANAEKKKEDWLHWDSTKLTWGKLFAAWEIANKNDKLHFITLRYSGTTRAMTEVTKFSEGGERGNIGRNTDRMWQFDEGFPCTPEDILTFLRESKELGTPGIMPEYGTYEVFNNNRVFARNYGLEKIRSLYVIPLLMEHVYSSVIKSYPYLIEIPTVVRNYNSSMLDIAVTSMSRADINKVKQFGKPALIGFAKALERGEEVVNDIAGITDSRSLGAYATKLKGNLKEEMTKLAHDVEAMSEVGMNPIIEPWKKDEAIGMLAYAFFVSAFLTRESITIPIPPELAKDIVGPKQIVIDRRNAPLITSASKDDEIYSAINDPSVFVPPKITFTYPINFGSFFYNPESKNLSCIVNVNPPEFKSEWLKNVFNDVKFTITVYLERSWDWKTTKETRIPLLKKIPIPYPFYGEERFEKHTYTHQELMELLEKNGGRLSFGIAPIGGTAHLRFSMKSQEHFREIKDLRGDIEKLKKEKLEEEVRYTSKSTDIDLIPIETVTIASVTALSMLGTASEAVDLDNVKTEFNVDPTKIVDASKNANRNPSIGSIKAYIEAARKNFGDLRNTENGIQFVKNVAGTPEEAKLRNVLNEFIDGKRTLDDEVWNAIYNTRYGRQIFEKVAKAFKIKTSDIFSPVEIELLRWVDENEVPKGSLAFVTGTRDVVEHLIDPKGTIVDTERHDRVLAGFAAKTKLDLFDIRNIGMKSIWTLDDEAWKRNGWAPSLFELYTERDKPALNRVFDAFMDVWDGNFKRALGEFLTAPVPDKLSFYPDGMALGKRFNVATYNVVKLEFRSILNKVPGVSVSGAPLEWSVEDQNEYNKAFKAMWKSLDYLPGIKIGKHGPRIDEDVVHRLSLELKMRPFVLYNIVRLTEGKVSSAETGLNFWDRGYIGVGAINPGTKGQELYFVGGIRFLAKEKKVKSGE